MHKVKSRHVSPGVLRCLSPDDQLRLISPRKPLISKSLQTTGSKKPLLFSQDGISPKTRNGTSLVDLAKDISTNGWKKDREGKLDEPIDLVVLSNATVVTLDHRRSTVVFSTMCSENRIFARVHQHYQPLPDNLRKRFGGAKNWGDAVQCRLKGNKFLNEPSDMLPYMRGLSSAPGRMLTFG